MDLGLKLKPKCKTFVDCKFCVCMCVCVPILEKEKQPYFNMVKIVSRMNRFSSNSSSIIPLCVVKCFHSSTMNSCNSIKFDAILSMIWCVYNEWTNFFFSWEGNTYYNVETEIVFKYFHSHSHITFSWKSRSKLIAWKRIRFTQQRNIFYFFFRHEVFEANLLHLTYPLKVQNTKPIYIKKKRNNNFLDFFYWDLSRHFHNRNCLIKTIKWAVSFLKNK